eukprot:570490-Prymnesium_polylepis.1
MVWAFATADVQHTLLDIKCTREISRSLCTSPGDWPQASLTQLHQWQTWASFAGADEQLLELSVRQ